MALSNAGAAPDGHARAIVVVATTVLALLLPVLAHDLARVPRATPIDYVEGWNAFHTARVMRGEPLYRPVDGLPLADPRLLDGPLRLFLGLRDGHPVATSGARFGHGLVDVDCVSCLAEARGTGIGGALTWAATLCRPEWPAVLIASDDGQPLYERMGYLRLLRMTFWHRPPPADRPSP